MLAWAAKPRRRAAHPTVPGCDPIFAPCSPPSPTSRSTTRLGVRDQVGRLPRHRRRRAGPCPALFPQRQRHFAQISLDLRGARRHQAGGGARRRTCGAGSSGAVRGSSCCRTPSGSRRGSSIACSICSISTARICAARRCSNARPSLSASCRRARCCCTARMSWAMASRPSTRPSGRARKASWPSSPAGATTPASARANG